MSQKYSHLLSPIKVGNLVLRNRLISSPAMPHFIQGPEDYPSPAMIELFAAKARAGAAVVTFNCALPQKRNLETAHAARFKYNEERTLNYFSQLTEAIHFEGAAASFLLDPVDIEGWDVSTGIPPTTPGGAGFDLPTGTEAPKNMLEDMAERCAQQALTVKKCGFDMVNFHAAYRFFIQSRFLSPLTNIRTDEFGGSLENRIRFVKMVCGRIKELCGKNFPIELTISGTEPEGGFSTDDVIEWSKLLDGYVDIIQIRAGDIDSNHPTGFSPVTPNMEITEKIKKGNPKMRIAAIAGMYSDFDLAESMIAEGKADFIASARAWISNSDYGRLIYEDRPEDLVPCVRCNKCHFPAAGCTYNSVCSVNPEWGSIAAYLPKASGVPDGVKKIAVIGGGPAGMEAARIAAGRGHEVTLYEKKAYLGGLLQHAEFAHFKWPLRDFNHFMIRKVNENEKVDIHLNTEVSPEMLNGMGYDHVIVAIGSKEVVPPIKGMDTVDYLFASDVAVNNRIDEMADEVVIIGGGEIGVETGLWIAETGRKVFCIEMREKLCADAAPVHYRCIVEDYWLAEKNFSFAVNAQCTKVTKDGVYYMDANDKEHFVKAGTILIATGAKPKTEEALKYFGKGTYTTVIGDCRKVGSVQTAMRTGYEAGCWL